MYHNKEKLAVELNNILQKAVLKNDKGVNIPLTEILDGSQIYTLLVTLLERLPKDDLESVQKFHTAFNVPKEQTHDPKDFKYSELRFRLILEETLELAKAFGFNYEKRIQIFKELNKKIEEKPISVSLKEVFDALVDLRVVVNGTTDVCNLGNISYEGMEEVFNSNMSKLIPDNENAYIVCRETKNRADTEDIPIVIKDSGNGYFVVTHRETGKILKPSTYSPPQLGELIDNLIINKSS